MENLLIDSFDFNPFDIDYGLDQFPGKGEKLGNREIFFSIICKVLDVVYYTNGTYQVGQKSVNVCLVIDGAFFRSLDIV